VTGVATDSVLSSPSPWATGAHVTRTLKVLLGSLAMLDPVGNQMSELLEIVRRGAGIHGAGRLDTATAPYRLLQR
jgi:hypothetical protein